MPYNPFIKILLSPNFALGHVVEWMIDPVFMEAEPYTYEVEVSGSPKFDEIAYTFPSTTDFMAIDTTNSKQAVSVDTYYRIKLTTSDRNTYYSNTLLFGSDLEDRRRYHMASEIVRKELLRMRKFTGVEGYLLKQKPFGKVRKDSVDPISGVPVVDTTVDFGTGIDGGYFAPLKIMISYEDYQSSRVLNQEGLGTSDTVDISFRTLGFPLVESRDIIVDTRADQRFIVKRSAPVIFPGTSLILTQKLDTSLLPYSDNIYKIVINK